VMCESGCGVCVYVCVAHRWLGRRRGMISAKVECKHVQVRVKVKFRTRKAFALVLG